MERLFVVTFKGAKTWLSKRDKKVISIVCDEAAYNAF